MTKHHTPAEWPVAVETTERATYWRLSDGTFAATKPSTILPPPIGQGGYFNLDALKKLKGDL